MKSWKTTTAGILGILGLLATGLAATLDNDPGTVAQWEIILPMIISQAGLLFARDNNVSSEAAGAK
jgi:hypothetical protein